MRWFYGRLLLAVSFLILLVHYSSGCRTHSMFLDVWGGISPSFGIFSRSQLIDWIRFRGLDVSFDVWKEVSVPKLALVFFCISFSYKSFWYCSSICSCWAWIFDLPSLGWCSFECARVQSRIQGVVDRGKDSLESVWGVIVSSRCPVVRYDAKRVVRDDGKSLRFDGCSYSSIRVMGVCT